MNQQQQVDKSLFKKTLLLEKETWMENFKKQLTAKLESTEANLRFQYSQERDKQIELAIERIEKETRNMQTCLQKNSENKLRYRLESMPDRLPMEWRCWFSRKKKQKKNRGKNVNTKKRKW